MCVGSERPAVIFVPFRGRERLGTGTVSARRQPSFPVQEPVRLDSQPRVVRRLISDSICLPRASRLYLPCDDYRLDLVPFILLYRVYVRRLFPHFGQTPRLPYWLLISVPHAYLVSAY